MSQSYLCQTERRHPAGKTRHSKMSKPKSKGPREMSRAADPWEQSLTERDFGSRLHEAKTVVKHQEEELHSVKQRLAEMEAFYRVILQKERLTEMEEFYKETIQQERAARKETEEELKSFKDRVAEEVDLTLQTGNSESMNSPVNETRLREMYEDLWKQWRKLKPYLQSGHRSPEEVQAWIQQWFKHAAEKMQQKKKLIETAFDLTELRTQTSQKVTEYTKLTIQNLQLAVYHSRKEDAAAQAFHEQKCVNPDDVMKYLYSKCCWLSYLLALNNPPLQPDWKNHKPEMDPWNIFPQDIREASAM